MDESARRNEGREPVSLSRDGGGRLADTLAIGVVVKPHGVRGHLKVRSFSGETGHFLRLREIELRCGGATSNRTIEDASAAGNDVLLKLAGVDDPETARGLAGCEVWVARKDAAPLARGEFYVADLSGCRAIGPSGPAGVVVAVVDAGGGDMLEVQRPDGRRVFVPFRDRFVGDVDVESRTIRLTEDFTDT
jgi:16S rRNA processing protein RimM